MMDAAHPEVSGERFVAVYRVVGDEARARDVADAICVEQTVEFPRRLLPPGGIERDVVGRLEAFESDGESAWRCSISFPIEDTGFELPQLLNVIWGNVSLLPRVRLLHIDLSPSLWARFPGPRFGRQGLRDHVAVHGRPLLCTALKPMGLDAQMLAGYAYEFAMGGIDLIKDDHGLSNQPFAPWYERVQRCAEAVAEANARTGRHTIYLANVTGPTDAVLERAHAARVMGAGGVLVSPGLVGFDAMRALAADAELNLPVMSHPAFIGSYVTEADSGIAFSVLFGEIMRLAGADAVIFPHYGGRLSLSAADCRETARGINQPMGPILEAFPVPSGGMVLEMVPEITAFYGSEVILLIGGGLFAYSSDVRKSSERFLASLENG